jgi:hypothetical protein
VPSAANEIQQRGPGGERLRQPLSTFCGHRRQERLVQPRVLDDGVVSRAMMEDEYGEPVAANGPVHGDDMPRTERARKSLVMVGDGAGGRHTAGLDRQLRRASPVGRGDDDHGGIADDWIALVGGGRAPFPGAPDRIDDPRIG